MEEYMKVWGLCQICNELRQYPELKPLHDKALAELRKMADEAAKEVEEEAAKAAAPAKESKYANA